MVAWMSDNTAVEMVDGMVGNGWPTSLESATVPAAVRLLSRELLIGLLGLCEALGSGGIHLVIVGGENGGGRRPLGDLWVRNLRDECMVAKVPFFFKQWEGKMPKAGGWAVQGREWNEMSAWPRVGDAVWVGPKACKVER